MRTSVTVLLFISTTLLFPVLAQGAEATLPAFPGAEGFGAVTVGGRGGRVIKVTNLNPSGPGSLQWACRQGGPRIVVFDVSGVIRPDNASKGKNWLSIKRSNITIAGQTAPGAGITIEGMLSTYRPARGDEGITTKTPVSDVIIRFLRIRPISPSGGRGSNLRGLENKATRAMFDHLSASWSTDDCVGPGPGPVTVQWCTVEESDIHLEGGDEPHNFAMHMGSGHRPITLHHTLMAHHHNRVPLAWAYPVDLRNNVIYNAGSGMETSLPRNRPVRDARINVVGNYSKPGPGAIIGIRAYLPPFLHAGSYVGPGRGGKYGVAGNYLDGKGGYLEPWKGRANLAGKPFDFYPAPIKTHTAEEAYELVLAHAGCLPRDHVSRRTVVEVRTCTGEWGFHGTKGGVMEGLTPDRPPTDSDNDGMPDVWEKAHGLNPADPADTSRAVPAGASPGDRHKGYTYIEFYINELADTKVAQALTRARLNRGPAKPWGKPARELSPGSAPHKSIESIVNAIREQNMARHNDKKTSHSTSSAWYAVQQLSRMGEQARPAVPELAKLVVGDDPRTVCFAAWGLGAIGPAAEDAAPALIKALKKKQNMTGRKWSFMPYGFIAWALGRIGPKASDAVPLLAKFMHGEDGRAHNAAAWALARMGPAAEGAIPELVKALASNTGGAWSNAKNTQVHAVNALAGIGAPAVPALIKACAGGDLEARRGAARALARTGPGARAAAPALLKLLEGSDPVARGIAALALARVDPAGAAGALTKALTDKELSVRHNAARALGQCGPAAASSVPALAEALKDETKEMQRAAALTLGKIGKAALPALKKALSGNDAFVRKYAARALGNTDGEAAGVVDALVKALSDKDAEVRREVAWSLALLGPAAKGAAAALEMARKNDADYVVRSAAAEALKKVAGN